MRVGRHLPDGVLIALVDAGEQRRRVDRPRRDGLADARRGVVAADLRDVARQIHHHRPQQIDREWTDAAAQDGETVGEQVEDMGLGGRRNRRHHRTERREQVQLAPDEPALQVERPAEVGLLVADGSPPR